MQNVGKQENAARRRRCKRDDQPIASRENLRHHKFFPGRFMERVEAPSRVFTTKPDAEPMTKGTGLLH